MARNMMLLVAATAVLWSRASGAAAPEPEASLVAVTKASCVFGGRRTSLQLEAASQRAFEGRLGWSLVVHGGTVARGEAGLTTGPGRPAKVTLPLDVPEIREGLMIPADLSVRLYPADGGTAAAVLEKRLWVCSENPFAGRSRWLEKLRIRLFDPVGKTRKVLDQSGIPYSQTGNVESLAAPGDGLVLVGEGVSLEAYRGLPRTMVEAATRGVPVLCLSPADGRIRLPDGTGGGSPEAERLTLCRAPVIHRLDKRLDAGGWPPTGKVASRSLVLAADGSQIAATVAEREDGWLWLEAGFPAGRGRLVVCLFDLVEPWEAGPVPRFLLARLLEYVEDSASQPPNRTERTGGKTSSRLQ